jgi:hypothetical protein
MSYVPDATLKTEPQDSQKASTAALEFRTLKAYIADVLIPFINTKFGPSGGIMTGQIVSSNAVPLRVHNDGASIQFYRTDGTTLLGTVSFNYGAWSGLSAAPGTLGLLLSAAGNSVNYDGGALFPSTAQNLGGTLNRWGVLFASGANLSGNLDIGGIYSGNGSGLTNLPAVPLTGSAIISALGYTPYPSSNPANYQAADGHVLEANYALTAGSAAKATTVAKDGTGAGMYFFWGAGLSSQPNWVWGGNDGISMNVWNPANFSVAYAATSGSALRAATADAISARGSNGFGTRTVSTSDPSGGEDGDVWFKY